MCQNIRCDFFCVYWVYKWELKGLSHSIRYLRRPYLWPHRVWACLNSASWVRAETDVWSGMRKNTIDWLVVGSWCCNVVRKRKILLDWRLLQNTFPTVFSVLSVSHHCCLVLRSFFSSSFFLWHGLPASSPAFFPGPRLVISQIKIT